MDRDPLKIRKLISIITPVRFRQSERGGHTVHTPTVLFPSSLGENTAASVAGSPRYTACPATPLGSTDREGMEAGLPEGPRRKEMIRLCEEGCRRVSWRVEEGEERMLETLTSKQKVTKIEELPQNDYFGYFCLFICNVGVCTRWVHVVPEFPKSDQKTQQRSRHPTRWHDVNFDLHRSFAESQPWRKARHAPADLGTLKITPRKIPNLKQKTATVQYVTNKDLLIMQP